MSTTFGTNTGGFDVAFHWMAAYLAVGQSPRVGGRGPEKARAVAHRVRWDLHLTLEMEATTRYQYGGNKVGSTTHLVEVDSRSGCTLGQGLTGSLLPPSIK